MTHVFPGSAKAERDWEAFRSPVRLPTTAGPDWGARNSGSRVGWKKGRSGTGSERLEGATRSAEVRPVVGRKQYEAVIMKPGARKPTAQKSFNSKNNAQRWAEDIVNAS